MNETVITSRVMRDIKSQWKSAVAFKHADRSRSGVPDISITEDLTSFWEFKYATPRCDSKGIQELTMKRLARTAPAWYVIFVDTPNLGQMIVIQHPNRFDARAEWSPSMECEALCDGFDYGWLLERMKVLHRMRLMHRRVESIHA